MSVLTLIFTNQSQEELQNAVEQLETQLRLHLHSIHQSVQDNSRFSMPIKLNVKKGSKFHEIHIKPIFPQFQLTRHGVEIYATTATWLGKFIVEQYEYSILKKMIVQRGIKSPDMLSSIEQYCQSVLQHDEWEGLNRKYTEEDRQRRTTKIKQELEHYFQEHVECHIEGFIHFRLRAYKKDLKDIVEYAFDEYMLNQQYEEFIGLLKYFVQIQESKMETVHIVQKHNQVLLYDDQYVPLEINNVEDKIVAEMLETEINIEDSVISHLVAVSPQKIVLHGDGCDVYSTRTVKTIFGDRMEKCKGCPICISKSEERMPYH